MSPIGGVGGHRPASALPGAGDAGKKPSRLRRAMSSMRRPGVKPSEGRVSPGSSSTEGPGLQRSTSRSNTNASASRLSTLFGGNSSQPSQTQETLGLIQDLEQFSIGLNESIRFSEKVAGRDDSVDLAQDILHCSKTNGLSVLLLTDKQYQSVNKIMIFAPYVSEKGAQLVEQVEITPGGASGHSVSFSKLDTLLNPSQISSIMALTQSKGNDSVNQVMANVAKMLLLQLSDSNDQQAGNPSSVVETKATALNDAVKLGKASFQYCPASDGEKSTMLNNISKAKAQSGRVETIFLTGETTEIESAVLHVGAYGHSLSVSISESDGIVFNSGKAEMLDMDRELLATMSSRMEREGVQAVANDLALYMVQVMERMPKDTALQLDFLMGFIEGKHPEASDQDAAGPYRSSMKEGAVPVILDQLNSSGLQPESSSFSMATSTVKTLLEAVLSNSSSKRASVIERLLKLLDKYNNEVFLLKQGEGESGKMASYAPNQEMLEGFDASLKHLIDRADRSGQNALAKFFLHVNRLYAADSARGKESKIQLGPEQFGLAANVLMSKAALSERVMQKHAGNANPMAAVTAVNLSAQLFNIATARLIANAQQWFSNDAPLSSSESSSDTTGPEQASVVDVEALKETATLRSTVPSKEVGSVRPIAAPRKRYVTIQHWNDTADIESDAGIESDDEAAVPEISADEDV